MKKCSSCGKIYNTEGNFCSSCGGRLIVKQPQTIQPQGNTVKEKPKKKMNIFLRILLLALAFCVGRLVAEFFINPPSERNMFDTSFLEETDNVNNEIDKDEDSSFYLDDSSSYIDNSTASNTEYSKIFSERNIVKSSIFFMTDRSASYAKVDKDGYIICMDYGYNDDVIIHMKQSIYYPIKGYTEAEIVEFENEMNALLRQYSSLSCCEIFTTRLNNHLVVTVDATNIDNKTAIRELYSVGLVKTSNADYLSMQITEESLLADGFVKE